jgi:polar amino acid transport system substrate-binding protein
VQPVTQSGLLRIRERGEIVVGALFNYRPLSFLADNGQMHGYEVAVIQKMAESWGVDVRFVQVTRQTRLRMLSSGEVDVLIGAVSHRRELEQFADFTDPVFLSGYVVVTRADSGSEIAAALGSGPVAVLPGQTGPDIAVELQRRGLSPALEMASSVDEALAALSSSSVSAIVGRREDLMLTASTTQDIQMLEEFLVEEPYAFAVARGDAPLRDLINQTLYVLVSSGDIGTLFANNLYGQTVDSFPQRSGEPAFEINSFPAAMPAGETVMARLRRGEAMRVAGFALSPGESPYDSQPIVDGFNRAVVNEMARRWNVAVTGVPSSTGALGLTLLATGQADLVVGLRPDLSLYGQVAMTQPYYSRGLRVIHLQDVPVLSVADLELKPVAVVEPADDASDLVDDNNSFPQIQRLPGLDAALAALQGRGVYAIVGDEFTLSLMAQSDPRIRFVDQRYRSTEHVMGTPLWDSEFRTLVNFTIQDMAADGTLANLYGQYFGPYLPPGTEALLPHILIWPGDGTFLTVRN